MKIAIYITTIFTICLTIACATVTAKTNTVTPQINYDAIGFVKSQALFGINPEGTPQNYIFKSKEALMQHIKTQKDEIDTQGDFWWEGLSGNILTEALDIYDDDFFAQYNLILAMKTESSGSIRYTHLDRDVTDDKLHITITRDIPEIGTMDMAYWNILIPIKKARFDGDIVTVEFSTDR